MAEIRLLHRLDDVPASQWDALHDGASIIVIGRPITQAGEPDNAARAIEAPDALEVARHLGERLLAHQACPQPRELAFGKLREARIKLFRDGAPQDAIAQELQPLVVLQSMAAMRQRPRQQIRIRKPVAEPLLERRWPWQGDLLIPGARREVDIHADVGEQRDFLAVGEADHDVVAFPADLEVRGSHRVDVVDGRAVLERPAHLGRGARLPFARDGFDRALGGGGCPPQILSTK